jgi:hypothetical protein
VAVGVSVGVFVVVAVAPPGVCVGGGVSVGHGVWVGAGVLVEMGVQPGVFVAAGSVCALIAGAVGCVSVPIAMHSPAAALTASRTLMLFTIPPPERNPPTNRTDATPSASPTTCHDELQCGEHGAHATTVMKSIGRHSAVHSVPLRVTPAVVVDAPSSTKRHMEAANLRRPEPAPVSRTACSLMIMPHPPGVVPRLDPLEDRGRKSFRVLQALRS